MKVIAVVLLILGFLAALLFFSVSYGLRGERVLEESSEFKRERFPILLFPAEGGDKWSRALIASLAEYDRDIMEVCDGNTAVTMPTSRFTPAPPRNYPAYVKHLNETFQVWGDETDWRSVEYSVNPVESGTQAILMVADKRGTIRKYTYLIDGTSVQPVKVRMEVDIARKMSN